MTNRLQETMLALALAGVAGCAGPRPDVPANAAVMIPQAWHRPNAETLPATPEEWLRKFDDPALVRIAERALANNVDMSIAAGRVAEARAQFQLAQSQRGINLIGGIDGARERSVSAFGAPIEQTAGGAGLTASYDVDLFGRLSNASAAARAALLASEAAHETVRIAVLTSAVEGYIVLRSLDERLQILNATLDARADEVQFTRRRASVGYSPVIDLKQAEAAYKTTEQLVPAVQLLIERQEHALSLLLGDNPRVIERGRPWREIRRPANGGVLPSELLVHRPDIVQAQQQLIAADRSLDAARAAFMPSIQLQASAAGVVSTLLENDPIRIFSFGGSVLAPIFDSGRLQAQQSVSAARRDQAAFGYRRAVLTAFREVEDALAAIELNDRQLRAVEAQREDLEQVLALSTKRYRAGYSPYLEQLEAQRALLSAELSAVQARADLLVSAIGLYRSIGAGWNQP